MGEHEEALNALRGLDGRADLVKKPPEEVIQIIAATLSLYFDPRTWDAKTIRELLDGTGLAFAVGADPTLIYARCMDFFGTKQKETERQAEAERKAKRDGMVRDQFPKMLEALESGADIGEALGEMARAYTRATDREERAREDRLKPARWDDIVSSLREKKPGYETPFIIGKGESGEPLRFQAGALSIVAAPTGHGKTTFLLNLLIHAARHRKGERHFLFSYEESAAALHLKTVNAWQGIPLGTGNRRILEGYVTRDERNFFRAGFADSEIQTLDASIREYRGMVEAGTVNVVQCSDDGAGLCDLIRKAKEAGAYLVMVDYIQLIKSDATRTRQDQMRDVCLKLVDVAKETQLPVILAAQFNRPSSSHPSKMANETLADAADIERAANLILGLWNGNFEFDEKDDTDRGRYSERGIAADTLYMEVLKARDEEPRRWATYECNLNVGIIRAGGLVKRWTGTPAKETMERPPQPPAGKNSSGFIGK